jgi:hypothetical protein
LKDFAATWPMTLLIISPGADGGDGRGSSSHCELANAVAVKFGFQ